MTPPLFPCLFLSSPSHFTTTMSPPDVTTISHTTMSSSFTVTFSSPEHTSPLCLHVPPSITTTST
uniref:Uncharacterized protein n=1 Tax=Octopus bimaculoides TaxID=37653 RepID=A0A0L8GD10_OCTBM